MMTLKIPFSLKNDKGFSLVELMIVVAIIGVLAALAVPKFQSFQAKAKQSEAKSNLSHIYTLEQSYYGDQDKYSALLTDIGFTLQGHIRYGYTASLVGTGFLATATATSNTIISSSCDFPDKWTIDQDKKLTLVSDCVSNNAALNRPM